MLHQLHPWHSPWASPLTQQVRTSSLPGPPVHRAMGSRVQRRSHACAESSTFQPPFGGGPCRSLQAEPCQRRRKPSVKLFKAHSCPCGGRRSSSRHLGSQGQEQTPKLPPSLGDVWKKRLCGGPGGGLGICRPVPQAQAVTPAASPNVAISKDSVEAASLDEMEPCAPGQEPRLGKPWPFTGPVLWTFLREVTSRKIWSSSVSEGLSKVRLRRTENLPGSKSVNWKTKEECGRTAELSSEAKIHTTQTRSGQ